MSRRGHRVTHHAELCEVSGISKIFRFQHMKDDNFGGKAGYGELRAGLCAIFIPGHRGRGRGRVFSVLMYRALRCGVRLGRNNHVAFEKKRHENYFSRAVLRSSEGVTFAAS